MPWSKARYEGIRLPRIYLGFWRVLSHPHESTQEPGWCSLLQAEIQHSRTSKACRRCYSVDIKRTKNLSQRPAASQRAAKIKRRDIAYYVSGCWPGAGCQKVYTSPTASAFSCPQPSEESRSLIRRQCAVTNCAHDNVISDYILVFCALLRLAHELYSQTPQNENHFRNSLWWYRYSIFAYT